MSSFLHISIFLHEFCTYFWHFHPVIYIWNISASLSKYTCLYVPVLLLNYVAELKIRVKSLKKKRSAGIFSFEICSSVNNNKAIPLILSLSLRSVNEEQQISNMTAQCIDSLHVALTCLSSKAALRFQKNHTSSVLIELNRRQEKRRRCNVTRIYGAFFS